MLLEIPLPFSRNAAQEHASRARNKNVKDTSNANSSAANFRSGPHNLALSQNHVVRTGLSNSAALNDDTYRDHRRSAPCFVVGEVDEGRSLTALGFAPCLTQ